MLNLKKIILCLQILSVSSIALAASPVDVENHPISVRAESDMKTFFQNIGNQTDKKGLQVVHIDGRPAYGNGWDCTISARFHADEDGRYVNDTLVKINNEKFIFASNSQKLGGISNVTQVNEQKVYQNKFDVLSNDISCGSFGGHISKPVTRRLNTLVIEQKQISIITDYTCPLSFETHKKVVTCYFSAL